MCNFCPHIQAPMVIIKSSDGFPLVWNDRFDFCMQMLDLGEKKPNYKLFPMYQSTRSVTNRKRTEKLSMWLILHVSV